MVMLKPLDAAWLYVDTKETPMHVGSLSIFSLPDVADETFIGRLFTHLRDTPTFASPFNLKLANPKLKGVMPTWRTAYKIDLDYHLRHSALPKPGGERELGILVSRLHSHPMDFNRPLWECHIIEGLANGRFALYMKMHHSLVDGVGGMRMLQKMMVTDPAATLLPPPWAIGRGARPRGPRKAPPPFMQALSQAVQQQIESAPKVGKALGHLVAEKFRKTSAAEALPFEGPQSVLNRRVSGQRRFATQFYPLERVKAVSKAAGVSINDVFLGLCAGALRRYLDEIQALPEAPLTAGIPVSIRPIDDDESGNAISFIIANLNTHLSDPLTRLQSIHRSTEVAKQQLQKLPKASLANYTTLFMAPFILQLLAGLGGKTRPMFNITVSNVPGPTEPLYFNGARLEQMYPVSLLSHGQGLNITVLTYAGQFNVGLTGCRDSLPHMQRLAVYMGEALSELEQKLGIKRRPETKVATTTKRRRRAPTV